MPAGFNGSGPIGQPFDVDVPHDGRERRDRRTLTGSDVRFGS
jgi:hypothetical protein